MTATVVNGALAVHHTATVDTPWDGPAAVAAMPNDAAVLKYCHAWQDGNGNPDAKGSYKDPHHLKEGGPANMAACRNGLARLPNTNIPAADKPGVERHLKAHLSDGGSDEETANHDHPHLVNGAAPQPKAREWFSIRNAADDTPAQVFIYDEIGGPWGVSAKSFAQEMGDLKATAIDLHINSPGGDVFDGIAIYNTIRRHPANVTAYIDGLAASAASFIAQAGNKVVVERNAQFMVHDASGFCWGNAADMKAMTDLLNKASDNIADVYAQRTGVDQSTWRDVMRAEAWYSSSEAVLAGLADEVRETESDGEVVYAVGNRTFDLKAMGARYASRQEAPEPPLPGARVTRMVCDKSPGISEPILTILGTVVTRSPLRPTARDESAVMVEPSPVHALTVFEREILDVVRSGMRVHATAPVDVTPEPLAFDPDAFRIAIRAGLATKR